MTVAELIRKLQTLDPHIPVHTCDDRGDTRERPIYLTCIEGDRVVII